MLTLQKHEEITRRTHHADFPFVPCQLPACVLLIQDGASQRLVRPGSPPDSATPYRPVQVAALDQEALEGLLWTNP